MASSHFADFTGRVAIITGGSRGIGRECALTLARQGCNVVIAAKTVTPKKNLPGTIYTVADEVRKLGVKALACKCDLRNETDVIACIDETVKTFGRIDIVVNNASALWWHDIVDTPVKRYDLINQINVRGTFLMTKYALPHMEKNGFGRVLTMSPPISKNGMGGHAAYNVSKMGMTMIALGVAAEYRDRSDMNITGNSLWPATIIESLASINFKMGDESMWRKATIISDATVAILSEGPEFTGQMVIDDEYLKYKGLTEKDFIKYRYDPDVEPPRLLAGGMGGPADGSEASYLAKAGAFKRGSVTRLEEDQKRSML